MAATTKEIARAIRAYFDDYNISQNDAAEKLGVTQTAVSALLCGRPFGKNAAMKWHEAFGFDPNYLMTGVGTLIGGEQGEPQPSQPQPPKSDGVFIPSETAEMYTAMAKSIDRLTQLVDRLTQERQESLPAYKKGSNDHIPDKTTK